MVKPLALALALWPSVPWILPADARAADVSSSPARGGPFVDAVPSAVAIPVTGHLDATANPLPKGLPATPPAAVIQFFGDLFVSEKAFRGLAEDEDPGVFDAMAPALATADVNVVNLEGAITSATMPYVLKTHRLRMPFRVAPLMRRHRIHVATLANNHSMDFGFAGLFDTLSSLQDAGISATGAGSDAAQAAVPAVVTAQGLSICILAYNRTLPQEFYAGAKRPGTNSPDADDMAAQVQACVAAHDHTFVTFHWGTEQSERIQRYQEFLAQTAIDAGATAVIGHHPHVLQAHARHKDRPILYSLGNFVFTTTPRERVPQGLAARFRLGPKGALLGYELRSLNVNNHHVRFRPRPLAPGERDPLKDLIGSDGRCRPIPNENAWRCEGQALMGANAGVTRRP